MSPSVVKAMAAFVYMAVLRDLLLCGMMAVLYKTGMDLITSRIKSDHIETLEFIPFERGRNN